MCNKKATFGRALPRRFNVSLLREPHIALPIKDNELIRSSREERERERDRALELLSLLVFLVSI